MSFGDEFESILESKIEACVENFVEEKVDVVQAAKDALDDFDFSDLIGDAIQNGDWSREIEDVIKEKDFSDDIHDYVTTEIDSIVDAVLESEKFKEAIETRLATVVLPKERSLWETISSMSSTLCGRMVQSVSRLCWWKNSTQTP